jgi:DNA-binding GntR family transcriptional regulator
VVVRESTEEDIRENYYLRELLESEAAHLAAKQIRPGELQALKSLNQAISEAISRGDTSKLIELNVQFHRRVREAARMPTLVRLIDQLWVGRTIFTPLFVEGRASRSVEEHAALISALESHNSEKAAAAMREHIRRAAIESQGERAKARLGIRRDGWDRS